MKLVVDADLQERGVLPCDTGSDRAILKGYFPRSNFQKLKTRLAGEGRYKF